jgi:hypothetical protein
MCVFSHNKEKTEGALPTTEVGGLRAKRNGHERSRNSRLDTPPHECGRFSGYAQPSGSRWRLTGQPGPSARTVASGEATIIKPCKELFSPTNEKTERGWAIHPPLKSRGFLALSGKSGLEFLIPPS